MLFVISHRDLVPGRQRELRRWLLANGLSHTELADPLLVDSVAGTLTVRRVVPVPGQEGLDFPELVVDAHDAPVTVEHVLDLAVRPLPWMLTMKGAWAGPAPTHAKQALIAR